MEMERMIAHSPGNSAFLGSLGTLVRLALDAQVHNVVTANGAVVHDNVPTPKSDRTPLLYFKPLLVRGARSRLGHLPYAETVQ
eukprot:GDKH01001092.1.p3 GENE.GDKH01001092.1~~GDKH01001092.1.p3  ORF type:complete len:83 (+),score=8.88 GDKH01001092.1:311-559(+)